MISYLTTLSTDPETKYVGVDPGIANLMFGQLLIPDNNNERGFTYGNTMRYSRGCDYFQRKFKRFNAIENKLKEETYYWIDEA